MKNPTKFYVPEFHQSNPSVKFNEPMRWLKVRANCFSALGSARSLQTCATYAAILLQCAYMGSHTIEIDSSDIAHVLRADERTIKKAILWLIENCFILDTKTEENQPSYLDLETEIEKETKTGRKSKSNRKFPETVNCEFCGNTGLTQISGRVAICSHCPAKDKIKPAKTR
jgi:hypothetical protein